MPLTSSARQVDLNKRTRRAGGRHFRVEPSSPLARVAGDGSLSSDSCRGGRVGPHCRVGTCATPEYAHRHAADSAAMSSLPGCKSCSGKSLGFLPLRLRSQWSKEQASQSRQREVSKALYAANSKFCHACPRRRLRLSPENSCNSIRRRLLPLRQATVRCSTQSARSLGIR